MQASARAGNVTLSSSEVRMRVAAGTVTAAARLNVPELNVGRQAVAARASAAGPLGPENLWAAGT